MTTEHTQPRITVIQPRVWRSDDEPVFSALRRYVAELLSEHDNGVTNSEGVLNRFRAAVTAAALAARLSDTLATSELLHAAAAAIALRLRHADQDVFADECGDLDTAIDAFRWDVDVVTDDLDSALSALDRRRHVLGELVVLGQLVQSDLSARVLEHAAAAVAVEPWVSVQGLADALAFWENTGDICVIEAGGDVTLTFGSFVEAARFGELVAGSDILGPLAFGAHPWDVSARRADPPFVGDASPMRWDVTFVVGRDHVPAVAAVLNEAWRRDQGLIL